MYGRHEKFIIINDNSVGPNLNASQPASVISRLVITKRAVKSVDENMQSTDIYHDNPSWTISNKIKNTKQLLRLLVMINVCSGKSDESLDVYETNLGQLVG